MGLCTFRNIKIEESITEERLNEEKRRKRPRKQATRITVEKFKEDFKKSFPRLSYSRFHNSDKISAIRFDTLLSRNRYFCIISLNLFIFFTNRNHIGIIINGEIDNGPFLAICNTDKKRCVS
jgi:hypothetical protein